MSWRAKLKNRESHLQHRDTEMRTQTQNSKGGRGEGKSQGWIRMSVLMYPWKSVSEIGNPQIISSSLPSLCSSFLSHRHWNLYIQPISRNLYLYELIHKAYLHPSFLNTEVFISNIYIKLSLEQIIYKDHFLPWFLAHVQKLCISNKQSTGTWWSD